MEALQKKYTSKRILLVDTFMIFLNLSTSYSIIPYILFTPDRFYNLIIIGVLNAGYYFIRFKSVSIERPDALFKIYVLLQIVCAIAGFLTNTGGPSVLVYFLYNTSFYFILCKLYKKYLSEYSINKTLWLIFRGYIVLVLLSVIGAIIVFSLGQCGFNILHNDVTTKYDLFLSNYLSFNSQYYFPFHLSITNANPDIRIPFFQELGLITGLYHEPHCMTFMCFPAVFLLLYYIQKINYKIIMLTAFLFIMLLESSTTNIIAILGCIILYLFYVLKSSMKMTFYLISVLLILIIFLNSYIDLSIFDFIFRKIDSGSTTYSLSTIDFALRPRTLFGYSFYNLGFVNSGIGQMDVGYLSFILNICYLVGCIITMIKLYMSKIPLKLYVLLFASYFFIHSTKVAMVSYSLSMLIFVSFIIIRVSRLCDCEIDYEKNN